MLFVLLLSWSCVFSTTTPPLLPLLFGRRVVDSLPAPDLLYSGAGPLLYPVPGRLLAPELFVLQDDPVLPDVCEDEIFITIFKI